MDWSYKQNMNIQWVTYVNKCFQGKGTLKDPNLLFLKQKLTIAKAEVDQLLCKTLSAVDFRMKNIPQYFLTNYNVVKLFVLKL